MPARVQPEPRPAGAPPNLVRVAAVLLVVNLALSFLVTILSFAYRDEIVDLTLAHTQHDQAVTDAARHAIETGLWIRAGVNVLIGVLYVFLISRLYRGRRWAWRRLVWLSTLGCLGIVYLLFQPYPAVLKAEQVVQLLVLAAIAVCVLHPDTRRHYAKV